MGKDPQFSASTSRTDIETLDASISTEMPKLIQFWRGLVSDASRQAGIYTDICRALCPGRL
jgi:hypothetical protein